MRKSPPFGERTPRRAGVGTLAAITLVFAGAGVVASRVVPVGYVATIDLQATPSAENEALLRQAIGSLPVSSGAERIALSAQGARLRAEARTEADAERNVATLAAHMEAQFQALAQAQRSMATEPVAVAEPEPEPEPANVEAPVSSPVLAELQRTADDAKVRLGAAAQALDDFENTAATEPEDDTERLREVADALEPRLADLRALQADRRRVGASSVTAEQVRAAARVAGRDELAEVLEQRRAAAEAVSELSRTLLDGHPRMAAARARLRGLDAELGAAKERVVTEFVVRIETAERQVGEARTALSKVSADDERREALTMRHTELLRARDLAADVSARLDEAVQQAKALLSPPAAPAATKTVREPILAQRKELPAPSLPPSVVRTTLPTETRHARPLPVALISGLFGFGLAGLGLLIRRRAETPVDSTSHASQSPEMVAAHASLPLAGQLTGLEVTSIDDVIDGAIGSGVSRIVLTGSGPVDGTRPLAVSIARRLSLRGRAVALVDLSVRQTASRTMGVAPSAATMTDLIEGRASFATIAARDFATQAEIVPGGASKDTEGSVAAAERRNVLDFIEKSYELIVIDCTDVEPVGIAALMDADAALLLAVGVADDETIRLRIEHMRRAGLDDMILVRDGAG